MIVSTMTSFFKKAANRFNVGGKNLYQREEGEDLLQISDEHMVKLAKEEEKRSRILYSAGTNLEKKWAEEHDAIVHKGRLGERYGPPVCFVFKAEGSETRRTHDKASGYNTREKRLIRRRRKEKTRRHFILKCRIKKIKTKCSQK